MVLGVIGFFFILYLYFQVKIKNNKNYPISLAMTLAFLVLVGNKSINWIIENINHFFDLNLKAPEQLSSLEVIAFFVFLYFSTALYYKFSFGAAIQKNSIFTFFQYGNNEQSNTKR
jgi:hypothetical protein